MDSIRGIAALLVIYCHSIFSFAHTTRFQTVCDLCGTAAGVSFFMLSGCVLGRSLHRRPCRNWIDYASFLVRRGFRLYPLAFVGLVFALLLAPHIHEPAAWTLPSADNLNYIARMKGVRTGMDFLWDAALVKTSLNKAYWTLAMEVQCSLLLPFIHYFSSRYPRTRLPMFVLFGAIMFFHVKAFQYVFVFYLGYLSNLVVEPHRATIGKYSYWILAPSVFLFFTLKLLDGRLVTMSLILFCIFLVFYTCELGWMKSMFNSRPLIWLGDIAFGIYLFHFPLVFLSQNVLQTYFPGLLRIRPEYEVASSVMFLMASAAAAILSLAGKHLIEDPFNKLGHVISSRLVRRPIPVPQFATGGSLAGE
ncbi:MAG TPA: acyltransferase [Chthoniobacteraceae bacterium]|nr:acyltransferase [Chthoniobacteraceae bacterium]